MTESSEVERIKSGYRDFEFLCKNDDRQHRLRPYQAWKQNGKVFLLLEYAAGMKTLREYFRAIHPPQSAQDSIAFWRSLAQLLVPLQANHEWIKVLSHDPTMQMSNWAERVDPLLYLIHQDISPENIFVASHPGSSDYEVTFKLGWSPILFEGKHNATKNDRDEYRCSIKMYSMSYFLSVTTS